jgi:hypothetical protein
MSAIITMRIHDEDVEGGQHTHAGVARYMLAVQVEDTSALSRAALSEVPASKF